MASADIVAELLATGRLARVRPSPTFVSGRLKQAADNVDSALQLADLNPRGSITLAYDAIRFAIGAHLQAAGLRVANAPGAHRASIEYARSRMHDLIDAADLDDIEVLRDLRNRIEYPDLDTGARVSAADARDIEAAARRTVAAVATWWFSQRSASASPPKPHE